MHDKYSDIKSIVVVSLSTLSCLLLSLNMIFNPIIEQNRKWIGVVAVAIFVYLIIDYVDLRMRLNFLMKFIDALERNFNKTRKEAGMIGKKAESTGC